MNIKFFINEIKEYGFKIALDNLFITWLKEFIGAKRIRITYWK